MKGMDRVWTIWVDTGGTFTDCIGIDPEGNLHTAKVLSSSSLRGEITGHKGRSTYKIDQEWNAPADFVKGFNFRLLKSGRQAKVISFDDQTSLLSLDSKLELSGSVAQSFEIISDEEAPVLAARLITKTLPGETLPPLQLRLATTLGTNALLEKKGVPPLLCITKGFEDLLEIGNQQRSDLFSLQIIKPSRLYDSVIGVDERVDTKGEVLTPIDLNSVSKRALDYLENGGKTAAIVLMNSPKNSGHEKRLKSRLLELGFTHLSVSSELSQAIRILPRAQTTVVNAYLAPVINKYMESIQNSVPKSTIHVMTSSGGLSHVEQFEPKESLLSGPAGGVVGAVSSSKSEGYDYVISFDMGGTSTDVARYSNRYDYVFEHKVGDAQLISPAVHVETVAAGGGSVCYFDGYKLCVGPESAGASPGPACYGAGGPLTITDVNLLLGRLESGNFHIPISIEDAESKFVEVIRELEMASGKPQQRETILTGFLDIANEKMAEAIRKISVKKGVDISSYLLTAFGGAGAQHACEIAKLLNMKQILVPQFSGLLSAYGLGYAQPEEFTEKQILKPLSDVSDNIERWIEELSESARKSLAVSSPGGDQEIEIIRKILSLRFQGQENTLEIDYTDTYEIASIFKKEYQKQFGHWIDDRQIELESIRVVASLNSVNRAGLTHGKSVHHQCALKTKQVWFRSGYMETPVYHSESLNAGDRFSGPAIILDPHSTVVVETGWQADLKASGAILLTRENRLQSQADKAHSEAVLLELFTNRFTSIAEQMGEMLRRTALSVNVKDRLDFSCALLNADGELVVNAPHIPVHLGALGFCVRSLMKTIKMGPGDVIVTNHPAFGGSHLPDVTVVTPIFTNDNKLIGFTANRAHHAEIGGTAPGSMPSDAGTLIEEGVVIPPMYLVKNKVEKWSEIEQLLSTAPFPSRSVEENLADLRAAVAANHYGVRAMNELVKTHGADTVTDFMGKLNEYASSRMLSTIEKLAKGRTDSIEFLDDGTPLKAAITISDDAVTFDFTGTGPVQQGNLNATPAIVNSVIVYLLRLLIDEDIPLNDGLLNPIEVILPECLLNPGFDDDPRKCPAVVGGNTEISQRLTDTLLKHFGRSACSQGTMNNVLFGNDNFGYYETVGGGTGAGPGFDGADAVHHHMTNTRSTDPELFEHKYPVRLEKYAIRKNSGGKGRFKGGDGIVRKITFLEPVHLSVLTQHRVETPYGLEGGSAGKTGGQWILYGNGKKEQLASVDGRKLVKGDHFILKTPGGGGYGKQEE